MEWTKYTTKEALKDNDELMILDKDANANKRTLMDKVWDYVVDKMTTAVIAKLGTTNKTLIGAVNELNRYTNIYAVGASSGIKQISIGNADSPQPSKSGNTISMPMRAWSSFILITNDGSVTEL